MIAEPCLVLSGRSARAARPVTILPNLAKPGFPLCKLWHPRKVVDFLINIALLVVILGTSALLTNAFTRRMYYRCANCGNLNAKRRTHCRVCQTPVGPAPG